MTKPRLSKSSALPIRDEYLAFGRPSFGEKEIAAAARVLRSGWVGMGPEVIAFERELAAFVGAPQVVTVNSCTSALHLALLVGGIGPGDEVIVPSLTWCSTANAARYLGATPVFCDIDPETLCLTPATVQAVLTRRTRAVIPVHFGGRAVDIAALREALPRRVAIVEDAAHALGARYPDGRPVGSSGNAVCFSFYANKNLSTGEGGAVALFDRKAADRLRSLRQHGLPADAWKRFTHPRVMPKSEVIQLGYKMNYTDLQAALGRVQLRRQREFAQRRLAIARHYFTALKGTGIRLQEGAVDARHARHLLVAILPLEQMRLTRDEVVLALRRRNLGASIHYPPLHRMRFYRRRGQPDLHVTDHLAERILTLPISASMRPRDADQVATHLLDILSHHA
jgi:dTDP-4-amino-4,6-dideoxygalactose transaminase